MKYRPLYLSYPPIVSWAVARVDAAAAGRDASAACSGARPVIFDGWTRRSRQIRAGLPKHVGRFFRAVSVKDG